MIRPSYVAAMVAFCSLLTFSSQAAAQTTQEKAATLYKQGIDLYFAEDYGLAITKFRAGFQLDPNPMFLYSLSLCFHKLGNLPDALDHAKRAEAAGGMTDRDTTSNRARIFAYGFALDAEQVATNVNNRPPPGSCVTNADCSGDDEICNISTKECVVQSPPDSHALGIGPVGYAGIGATALGVGLLVGGGITSLAVKGKEKDLAALGDSGASDAEIDALVTQIDKQKNLGKFFVLGGVGMVAVGVGLFVVDMFVLQKSDNASTFYPVLQPDGAGVGWVTRF